MIKNFGITDSVDLYDQMLEVKNGTRGHASITKKHAKECKIEWSFVENSAKILGLKISQHGRYGYSVTK